MLSLNRTFEIETDRAMNNFCREELRIMRMLAGTEDNNEELLERFRARILSTQLLPR